MMYPLNPEEDDYLTPPSLGEDSFGGRLRVFHDQFDSSIRAILRDCLYREVVNEEGTIVLQILCPNQAVQKRLIQKRQKIGNNIRSIWPNIVNHFALCVQNDGLHCRVFPLDSYLID